jgi:hypothetical protein
MRIHPQVPLPIDTPQRMVEIFRGLRSTASPAMQEVLNTLILKLCIEELTASLK